MGPTPDFSKAGSEKNFPSLPEPKSNACSVWKASFMIQLSKAKGHGCRKSAVYGENPKWPLYAARSFMQRHSLAPLA